MNRSRLLFFFLLACFVAVSTGRVHVQDEVAVLLQARGLVETGALVVAEPAVGPAFYGLHDRDGRLRAPNGPAHGALLVRYVTAAVTGDPALPFGAGFDRWFVLLGHAGVAWPLLLAVAASALAVALWSGLSLAGAGRGRMIWFGSAPGESRVR